MKASFISILITVMIGSCHTPAESSKVVTEVLDYGKIESGVYTNPQFGMTIPVPVGWDVQNTKQTDSVHSRGEKMTGGDTEEGKRKLDSAKASKGGVLFAINKRQPGSNAYSNPSLMTMVDKPDMRLGLTDAGQYLDILRKSREKSDIPFKMDSVITERIGGRNFLLLHMTVTDRTPLLYQDYYSSMMGDYVFDFIITYNTEAEHMELKLILSKVDFKRKDLWGDK